MARAGIVGVGVAVLLGAAASAGERTERDDQSPDIELLEYLGDLVHAQERWLGPEDMPGAVVDERDAPIVLDDDSADVERLK
jgi:hypothetical protein